MFKQFRLIVATLTLCLPLLGVSAMAQTATTGSIEGDVIDVNNAAIPGVTVNVTSPNLIRPQSATSDAEGRFRILNLPPGRYEVVVESVSGFGRFERKDVEVNLSRSSTVSVQLSPEGASATVEVSATAGDTIDTTDNTAGTNVSTDQFSNFPTQRTVQSLYSIAPTAARSGLRDASGRDRDPSVAGSSGPENNYILDGVNTSDPAFGGSGANLPFEFIQEVEVKTGAYGAEYGKSTGGIFNVVTKSGGNDFRGDVFAYFSDKSFVRDTKSFPFTGSAPNGFSEVDAGFDIGGPIVKDKLWFFGAFNPQRRKNFYLTQTFRQEVENKVTTPFYAGKITWAPNQNNIFTFSTFGDYTKQEGFQVGATGAQGVATGFGASPNTFQAITETGGQNYSARLNSTITPNWIGEFAFGYHKQRANVLPAGDVANVPLVTDSFAILRGDGTVAPVTSTNTNFGEATGFVDYVFSPGGSLQRGFLRQGFGLFSTQDRERYEATARFQNIYKIHTFKYGFEYNRNLYAIDQRSTGTSVTFADPNNLIPSGSGINQVNGYRTTNAFLVCTTRALTGGLGIVCPNAASFARANAIANAANGFPGGASQGSITSAEALNNPFLIRNTTTIRDFQLVADTYTNTQSFYIQDDLRVRRDLQFNVGVRWDYQQSYGAGGVEYLKLNDTWDNLQPRVGFTYDYTGRGRGKVFANYARFLETPIPLDVNVRAGGGDSQTDKQFRVNRVNAPTNSLVTASIGNLGAAATPIDPDLKPATVNEYTAGIEFEAVSNMVVGARGIYRAQGSVIEDGSFDDGNNYFLFNPGESLTDRIAALPPAFDAAGNQIFGEGVGGIGQSFGRARRYYRGLEFTATKRFTNNYQFIASYVFSSLTGNYEGLFRNDNGQSDPNITSLFDLVSLLGNSYGRLPNDRPHQIKFNGTYQTPFKLLVSGNFYGQSGTPFNQLVPHPVYGNNEGFGVPRGTAVVPNNTTPGVTGLGGAVGTLRSPFTYNLDLGAYYPIALGEERQLRFQVDWFNALNSQRAVTMDQTFSINSGVAGVPAVANPFYGTGAIFQFPSSVRLGVKLQF